MLPPLGPHKSRIQTFWANLGQIKEPPGMCAHFDGTLHGPGYCVLDFSQLDSISFFDFVDGVDTSAQLCDVVYGKYGLGQCIVDLKGTTAASVGSEDVTVDACKQLRAIKELE
ncbi:hypothetical protein N0V90_007467 [Kalmusia sp. IMI 367209]|nr:hypothetical protein N0V90_007467 [Kalmusia sp. IMI 367209]